jgi:hypothetical protein
LNIILGLVAVLIAAAVAKTWVSPVVSVPSSAVTKPLQEAEALVYSQTARPPLTQFDGLLEKNPFKQPPPMPVRPLGASPPPPPLPTLVGTILVDHDRRAILSDKGKANIYTIGQEVAGGAITEIKEDRIIFKRGDTTREIMLKAAIESTAATPAKASAPIVNQAGVPAQSSGPSQPPTPDVVPDREEMQGRREERLRERRERLEQRKAMQQGMR